MIFLLENSEIQRKEEPWKIFQRYLLNGLYFLGESYKTRSYYENLLICTGVEFQHFSGYNTSKNAYNFSKMIIKQIISIEDWGISSMTERQFSLDKVSMKFTYWDYIQTFNKALYYNSERHTHTWFIKVCTKIFANPIPNWFLNWWSYYGPTIKILLELFLKLYREWVKVSPDLNNLYHQEHDPQTKSLYGQELLDLISKTIQDYKSIPHKGIIADTSMRHMARRISNQDEDDQNKMINNYLEKIEDDRADYRPSSEILVSLVSEPRNFHGDSSTKSTRLEEVDIPQNLDLLNKWTIRKIDIKTIYDYDYSFLNKRDIDIYKNQYKFLHIGMVQIAFKPLTLKGLPETFLAALRDARNLNFRQSLMGSIESMVAYGPVYFNT
ncbi:hypothetical protein H5410_050517 [Solanum commersonii]|uniref:Uncharacterized protein n=1 Tax=Solanum commersonii TaxID=4109 RepID=A0A9J5WVR7_SOLCO|nr:hypothetical protein H5410_050517 [Solanum commersonii]